jgi:hypothetical protein
MPFPSQDFYDAYKADILDISEQIAYNFNICVSDVTHFVRELLENKQEKKKEVKTEKKKIQLDDEPDEEATLVDTAEKKEEKKETTKPEKKKTEKVENPHEGKTCQHKMTAGKKKGELCGDKVHVESKTGIYCKTHLKNEAGNKFLQSTLSTTGEVTAAKTEKKEETKKTEKKVAKKKEEGPLINNNANIKEVIEQRTSQITIKKNKKWSVYEHPETGLVIEPISKEVVGRLNNDTGIVSPLTPEDIDLAKTLGFKKIKIPDNLPTKKIEKSELYDDDDDEEDISDVEDDEDDEDD